MKKILAATIVLLCWLTSPITAVGAGAVTTSSVISGSTAYLSGVVNGATSSTRAYFEYGTDLNYGSFSSSQTISSPGSQNVSIAVKGVAPGTYHYRLFAVDGAGVAMGNDLTFTINGPVAMTLPANAISSSNITLNGFVTPIGAATTVYFQYGLTIDVTNQTAITNLNGSNTTYLITNKLSLPGNFSTVFYRIVASNSFGVTIGTNLTVSWPLPAFRAFPQAVSWNVGNTNPPLIQLAGAGTNALTYNIVRPPRFGTIVTNLSGGIYTTNTGTCQYLPNAPATFFGQDSFTFKVGNGTNSSAEATVNISVLSTNNINHAPHAQNQSIKTLKNTPCNGYLTGDDDADAVDPHADLTNYADPNHKGYHYSPSTPNLTYTILSLPTHGTLATNLSFFMYTPTNNYLGTDSFTFKVNDGALDSTNVGTVSIVVATNVGAIRPGFDKFSFGRADDESFTVNLTGTNSDWLGRDLLLQFSNNKFPTNYFTQFYANNNGNLTFRSANGAYMGTVFPTANGPMIAPYWADVVTTTANSGVMTYGMQYVGGRLAVGVTWTNVMTYQNTSNFNSFQVVLIDRSDVQVGNFDVEFNYDKIEWLVGAVSQGTYPSVGFDRGDGLNFYNLPGSSTANLVDASPSGLVHSSNVLPAVPGRYTFQMYQPSSSQSIIAITHTNTPITLSSSSSLTATNYSYAIIAGPTNGTLTGTAPYLTYQPYIYYYSGPDAFTFTMSDGTRTFTNTVMISVVGWPSTFGTDALIGPNDSVSFVSQIDRGLGDTTAYVRYGTTTNYGRLAMLEDVFPGGRWELYQCNLETNRGAALSFNGRNQYVKVPATISNDFTIEFWFLCPWLTSLMEGQWSQGLGLVDGYVPGGANDFGVSFGNGKVLFGVGGPDTTIASGRLLDGNWHHVAATRVRASGAMALYIDGVLTASTNGSTATLNGATNLTIGCLATLTNFFAGSLDEVRLWNVARTQIQIQQNMNRNLGATNAGLVACYHMDDWPGPNALDASGNGNTGTIFNNPDWTTGNIQNGPVDTGMYHFEFLALNQAGLIDSGDMMFGLGTNAALSSLTVNPGSLVPSFSPIVFTYMSTVANSVSNVDYISVAQDPHAPLEVQTNGGGFSAPVSGVLSNRVTLNFGANLISIRTTSPNGQSNRIYTLNVIRQLSDDATLSNVTASGTTLTLNGSTYSGQFPTAVSNTTITAITSNPNATLQLDGSPLTSGVASGLIPLSFGTNVHILTVTSQSGVASVVYTVNLTRQLNTNADLVNLTCSGGALNPTFSSNTTTYSLTVSNNVSSIVVTPTSADSVYATIQARVNGGTYSQVSSGTSSGALGLNIGANTISILVTAQDRVSSKVYTLTVTRQAGLPVVSTQTASAITVSSALLNGIVNPNGAATKVSFQYGADTNYTLSTTPTDVGSGTSLQSVGASIGGLLPGMTNYFRVVASNSFGVVLGADMNFVSLAAAPVVTNVTADQLAHFTANLHGAVNPNGAVTTAYFRYGQSTNYDSATIVTNLGGGNILLSVDTGLSNLIAGKTYHYQLVATNSAGASSSQDMTFTMLPPPQATSIQLQADGSFQLQFSGGAGLSYTLQTSADLTNWMNFTNLLAGTNGLLMFNDASTTNSPIRFYRLTQP